MADARAHFDRVQELATRGGLIGHQRQAHTVNGQMDEHAGDLNAARRHYEASIALATAENESIRATLWSMHSFSDQRYGYDGLMRILRQQRNHAEAFEVWSQSRGRFLRDTRLQAALLNEMSAEVRLRYDSLTTQLNSLRTRRAATSNASDSALLEREAVLITQRNELLDLSVYVPALPQAELQRWLRDTGRTLVAYHVDTPSAIAPVQETVSAYVVHPDTIVAVALPHTPQSLRALVERVSPLLAHDAAASMNASAFDLNALHEAYQTLLAPLRPYLSDGDGLVIAPDGPLFQLPFSALVTAPPESRYAYRSAQYLIEERPVLSTLSPSLLVEDARAPERNTEVDIAAFGVSEFGGAPPPNDLLASEIRLRSSTDMLSMPDLPGVATELDQLDRLFSSTHLSLNSAATPQSVRIHGSDATIVHLASHALLSSTDPLNSAFVLAPGESSDGLLRVHEIMQPGAQIPLVVLSGCSTARGELRSGEGLLGLQYAFQASGARSTLSHLWPTDDDTAVALSTAFYENLRSGLSKDVALQQAQRAFMEAHSDQRSPFFWASPVLFGTPNALTLAPARSRWIQVAWIAVGLAGIGGLLLLVRRYRTDTG
jgi:CHAT domain-containing protein